MCGTNSDAMLAWAVERGLLAVASRALELGADPNGQDDFGATLLMHAAWQVRLAASSSLHNIPTRCRFQVALFRALHPLNRLVAGFVWWYIGSRNPLVKGSLRVAGLGGAQRHAAIGGRPRGRAERQRLHSAHARRSAR